MISLKDILLKLEGSQSEYAFDTIQASPYNLVRNYSFCDRDHVLTAFRSDRILQAMMLYLPLDVYAVRRSDGYLEVLAGKRVVETLLWIKEHADELDNYGGMKVRLEDNLNIKLHVLVYQKQNREYVGEYIRELIQECSL